MEIEKIKANLKQCLSEKRYRHSIGVAEEAVRLAKHYGADEDKAYLAGLVHDCAKEIDAQEAVRLLREEYGIIPDAMKLHMPTLLHGPLGACIAQSRFDIYDTEILDAVRYHTTGKANMSLLSKIVYIADYIEPGRDQAPNLAWLRQLAFTDIDQAVCEILKQTLDYLRDQGGEIDPATEVTYSYYLQKCAEDAES